MVSLTFAAEATAPSGKLSVETTMWYLVPRLPRSVGLGPVSSPPCLARTLQLSTTMSRARAGASGPDRAIRSRTACTRGSSATLRQSRSRRRNVEPEARPVPAKSSRHWTPSRKKNCSVATTSVAGRRGLPRSVGSSSNCSMIPATRSITVTLNAHSMTTDPLIYGNGHAGFVCAEGRKLCDAGRTDFWKPPLNDVGVGVVAAIEAFVVEEPGVGILHDGADGSEAGAMFGPFMPDHGLDALAQAEPAVVGAVVAGISQEAGDRGADDQGEAPLQLIDVRMHE